MPSSARRSKQEHWEAELGPLVEVDANAIRDYVEARGLSLYAIAKKLDRTRIRGSDKTFVGSRQRLDIVIKGGGRLDKPRRVRREFARALAGILKVKLEDILVGAPSDHRPFGSEIRADRVWTELTRAAKRELPISANLLAALFSYELFHPFFGTAALADRELGRAARVWRFTRGMEAAFRALTEEWVAGRYEIAPESVTKLVDAVNAMARVARGRLPEASADRTREAIIRLASQPDD